VLEQLVALQLLLQLLLNHPPFAASAIGCLDADRGSVLLDLDLDRKNNIILRILFWGQKLAKRCGAPLPARPL